MAINKYRIKKWWKMLTGKSLLHVQQGLGAAFSVEKIEGYYNDLTQKVLLDTEYLENPNYVPIFQTEQGENVYFPITIIQYGLGAYDLFLTTKKEIYLQKFFTCAKWTIENQAENGNFNCMFFVYPNNPYSAMCQGEAASLLLRAFAQTGEEKYYSAAKKAIDFMLLPLEQGGTAKIENDEIILLEYTHLPAVMNGWVFALFGLFDFAKASKEQGYQEIFDRCVQTLEKYLPNFDHGYWSKYDLGKKIASPFYHRLHIAQMQALYQITGKETFEKYAKKWQADARSFIKRTRAFIKKAWQKIFD